jgi:hypothetical protein
MKCSGTTIRRLVPPLVLATFLIAGSLSLPQPLHAYDRGLNYDKPPQDTEGDPDGYGKPQPVTDDLGAGAVDEVVRPAALPASWHRLQAAVGLLLRFLAASVGRI